MVELSNNNIIEWYDQHINHRNNYGLGLKVGLFIHNRGWFLYYKHNLLYIGFAYICKYILGKRVLIPRGFLKDIIDNKDEYINLYNTLSDYESKMALLSILTYIRTGEYDSQLDIDFDFNQYFDNGIISLKDNEIFVDGGGYIGDTVESFISRVSDFEKIYFFEPDKNNYNLAEKHFNKWNRDVVDKIILYNAGIGDKSDSKRISSNGIGSKISDIGEINIPILPLDNINEKFTYIKMDIEGYELNALNGARNHIKYEKPKLAICVYHKPKDLWKIPKYVLSINQSYKIYLRQYSYDWVMYFI